MSKIEKKDAYYFSHDSNARHDLKIIRLESKFGIAGYAYYFKIIEILREQRDYCLEFENLDMIAFDLRCEYSFLQEFVNYAINIELFVKENNIFFSKSLNKRMQIMTKKKETATENGRCGGRPKNEEIRLKTERLKTKIKPKRNQTHNQNETKPITKTKPKRNLKEKKERKENKLKKEKEIKKVVNVGENDFLNFRELEILRNIKEITNDMHSDKFWINEIRKFGVDRIQSVLKENNLKLRDCTIENKAGYLATILKEYQI